MTKNTTATPFERMCDNYNRTGKAKVSGYVAKFERMDSDTLLKEFNSISYRMSFVSNDAYCRMLPVKNAMYRVLKARGIK